MSSDRRVVTLLILAVVTIAALLNAFHIPVAGRRMRPEHLIAPLAFVALAIALVTSRKPLVRIDAFSLLAVAWAAINLLSSWLFAPQWTESQVHVVRMSLLVLIFLTVANLPSVPSLWAGRVRLWLALALCAVSYGILAWLVVRLTGTWLPGVAIERGFTGISVHGTQMERNLFGILAATLFAVFSYVLMARRSQDVRGASPLGVLVAACGVAGLAVAVSLTRSAWLAIIVVGPLSYLFFDRRSLSRADRPLLLTTVTMPVLLVAFIGALMIIPSGDSAAAAPPTAPRPPSSALRSLPGSPAPVLSPVVRRPQSGSLEAESGAVAGVSQRLQTLGQLENDFTLSTRLEDARWAFDDWRESPIIGRGTGAFVQIHGIREGTPAWVSNQVLHTMVDTGLVGLAIQMSLFMLVAYRAWNASRQSAEAALSFGLRAMTLGFLVMMVAYQFTDGTWLAVFWVHLGLMVNGIYCVRAEASA